MWSIGQLYVFSKLQKISSKILSYEKLKKTEKDSKSFCKVISLAPLCVLAPVIWLKGSLSYRTLNCLG
jgi:hypothetical protein